MNVIEVRVIIFPQGDFYVAQGLEYDIRAKGKERAEVEEAFGFVLAGHCQTSIERGEKPMDGVPSAPKKFFRMWQKMESAKRARKPEKARIRISGRGSQPNQVAVANFAFA